MYIHYVQQFFKWVLIKPVSSHIRPIKILTIILLEHHFTLVYSFQSLNNANRRECGRNKSKMSSRTLLKGPSMPAVPKGVKCTRRWRNFTLSMNIAKLSRRLGNKSEISSGRLWPAPPPGLPRRHLHPFPCFLVALVSSRFSGIFLSQNKMRWLFSKPIKAAVLNDT